jgi:hypothetical protein
MSFERARYLALVLSVGLIAGLATLAWGQTRKAGPNEVYVEPGVNVEDAFIKKTGDFWVLDFKFKSPRLINVNIPGKGERTVWYLWYQVINYSSEPRTFVPDFELVTHDKGMAYPDQILPAAMDAIRKIEDPHGFYNLKNTVTIAKNPIPVSSLTVDPKPVTGIVTWIDPNLPEPGDDAATIKRKKARPKLADSNRYSIFVAGLSNGFRLTDDIPPNPKKQIVSRKTLQLTFQRLGDSKSMRSDLIRFKPPATWIYRSSKVMLETAPAEKPAPPAGK